MACSTAELPGISGVMAARVGFEPTSTKLWAVHLDRIATAMLKLG